MLLVAPGTRIGPEHLMLDARRSEPVVSDGDDEKQRVLDALEECAGNQTRAAKLLGITRRALIVRLERYGINRPRR